MLPKNKYRRLAQLLRLPSLGDVVASSEFVLCLVCLHAPKDLDKERSESGRKRMYSDGHVLRD